MHNVSIALQEHEPNRHWDNSTVSGIAEHNANYPERGHGGGGLNKRRSGEVEPAHDFAVFAGPFFWPYQCVSIWNIRFIFQRCLMIESKSIL